MPNHQIQFDIGEILSDFQIQFNELNQSVKFISHAIREFEQKEIDFLKIDGLPIEIQGQGIKQKNFSDSKVQSQKWLISKACGELIETLKLSLAKAMAYLKFYQLSETKVFENENQVSSEIEKVQKRINKLGLPDLIKTISEQISIDKKLAEHIKSINNARNCLVHRNGKVQVVDVNNQIDQTLDVEWVNIYQVAEHNGEKIRITAQNLLERVHASKLHFYQENKLKSFKVGYAVNFDENDFTGFTWSFMLFLNQIYESLPRPNE